MSITPLKVLMKWREYVRLVYEATKKVLPIAEVYLVGSAAEGKLRVTSDIDVVIALPHKPTYDEIIDVRVKVIEEAEKLGLPPYAPIELHVISKEELSKYLRTGSSVVPVGKTLR